MDELIKRALAAYFRAGANVQPSARGSAVRKVSGKSYVVLSSGGETLAVYRVRNDGMLKRLKRWPAPLDRDGGE